MLSQQYINKNLVHSGDNSVSQSVQTIVNKGQKVTYHGLFRQIKSVKTVADFQDSCSQSVSQSVCQSVSHSVNNEKVMSKSWAIHEKVMNNSWASHYEVMSNSWENQEKVTRKIWKSHKKVVRKSWKSHGKSQESHEKVPWESYGKVMKKS